METTNVKKLEAGERVRNPHGWCFKSPEPPVGEEVSSDYLNFRYACVPNVGLTTWHATAENALKALAALVQDNRNIPVS